MSRGRSADTSGYGTSTTSEIRRSTAALQSAYAASRSKLAPHPLSVVCFRYAPPGLDEKALESLNAAIMHAVNATGEVFISHTKIDGRYALITSSIAAVGDRRSLAQWCERRAMRTENDPAERAWWQEAIGALIARG